MKHRIKIKEWMAVRLYTWRLGWWKVKFWSGWSRRRFSLSFSLSARPSAQGGADTCSLCLVSSMQKNIWCMKQTGEANLVSCLHIIISPRQLAPAPFKEKKKIRKKENCQRTRQLPLSVWLRHADMHQGLCRFQGAQKSSAFVFGKKSGILLWDCA